MNHTVLGRFYCIGYSNTTRRPLYKTNSPSRHDPMNMMSSKPDLTRRRFCSSLGAHAVSNTPKLHHDKWLHAKGTPPSAPVLPCGNLWELVNQVKVLHQYTELVSEAAKGHGPHAFALYGGPEACVDGLEWMAPLCLSIESPPVPEDYHDHMAIWRANHSGDFTDVEAAFHVHQSYVVEDPHMTRFLVSLILPGAREYERAIAGNILRARPASFEEFHTDLLAWRDACMYHPVCLAAQNMPRAESWVPQHLMHESQDWQELLDEFNQSSFCTGSRLACICEKLADRSPEFNNHICGVLDRVAILMRVKSNYAPLKEGDPTPTLDDVLHRLQFQSDPLSPYTHSLKMWGTLKPTLEASLPPSLMCQAMCLFRHDTWSCSFLELRVVDEASRTLHIHSGRMGWEKRGDCYPIRVRAGLNPDRFQDIIARMGESASCPEVAHMMLSPDTLSKCLAGDPDNGLSPLDIHLFSDRDRVLRSMDAGFSGDSPAFTACIKALVACLPSVQPETFPTPLSVLAWRIDCPPRVILYTGESEQVDLHSTPPHTLPKTVIPEKIPKRTVSGISVLSDTGDSMESLRSCIVQDLVAANPGFGDHPMHQISVRPTGRSMTFTSTTLAEAVAVFSCQPPGEHSILRVGESAAWDKEHIDDRYAESQLAINGVRFRDWLTMFKDGNDLHRCRLASHHVKVNELFHTHFPVGEPSGYAWVSVASTLPTETRVLRHLGGKTDLEALKRSVENRFMNDAKLLPLWHPTDTVKPSHMEIYTDEAACQVAIVYAPVSADGTERRLELMSFRPAS